jgi:hypothetical protein
VGEGAVIEVYCFYVDIVALNTGIIFKAFPLKQPLVLILILLLKTGINIKSPDNCLL